jgi:hypothetical protein
MEIQHQNPTPGRLDRLIHEQVYDPYKTKNKLPEPTVCPVCHAVFRAGRWQCADSWPMDAHRQTCQACHRTQDAHPAGIVTVSGAFALSHRSEVLSLARHNEQQEKLEHPLHRIMQIQEKPDSIVIKTTDIHLPHSIAEALRHAYKGNLQFRYIEESCFITVNWSRER